MTEERFRELLYEQAEKIVSDIAGDHGVSADYEVAVRDVRDSFGDTLMLDEDKIAWIGLIYMGELGHWWFAPEMAVRDGELVDTGDVVSVTPRPEWVARFRPVYDLEA